MTMQRQCRHMLAALAVLLGLLEPQAAFADARVKDVTRVRGVRSNHLLGYGLVTGLKGTGDSLRNSPFTNQSMRSMLENFGVTTNGAEARTRNVAAVVVSAELPAFAARGSRLDVTVSSIGDASSLAGGSLVLTPLSGPDGEVYAVAQGSVLVSGFESKGQSEALTHGVPTTGRISGGALIEQDAPGGLQDQGAIHLDLVNPDFQTAVSIADAINRFTGERYREQVAREVGPSEVLVALPRRARAARFIAEIGGLRVATDAPARVVVDERTGTIVIGTEVRVSRVAVTHGNLTVRVTEDPQVSQPEPFTDGRTVVTSRTEVTATQEPGLLNVVEGVDLQTLVTGLNRLGLKPPGIIAILQAIKSAGALQAELVVQ